MVGSPVGVVALASTGSTPANFNVSALNWGFERMPLIKSNLMKNLNIFSFKDHVGSKLKSWTMFIIRINSHGSLHHVVGNQD